MKRLLILLVAINGLLVPGAWSGPIYQWTDESGIRHFSDTPAPAPRPALLPGSESPAGPVPGSNAVFWKIEKPGLSPSFILGTLHVEDPRVLTLPPAVEAAFEASDALVLELVLDETALFKAAASMIAMDGTDLETILGKALFKRAASAMKDRGVPEMALRRMKPWAVMATLIAPRPKTGNFLDMKLYRRALQSKKKVFGLETVKEQVTALESLPMQDQVEILRQTLDHLDTLPEVYESMIQAYLAGDLAGLMALSQGFIKAEDRALANRFMRRLNEARNIRMVRRLRPHLKQGNIFIAIGALHLPGKKGTLHLLEKQGYTVRPGL